MKKDEKATKLLSSAVKGGISGATTGAVFGAATGAITGKLKTESLKKASGQKAIDAITPDVKSMSKNQYIEAVNRGKISEKTKLSPAKYIMDEREIALGTKYKNLLQKNDPVANINKISSEIKNRDEIVGKYLASKKIIYNKGELRNSLLKALEKVDDVTIDEARLNKEKAKLAEAFIKSLEKNDLENLWMTRKNLDRIIGDKINAFSGKPALKKELYTAVRRAANDFITNKLGNSTYANQMKEMSEMFRLIEVLDNKAYLEKGKSALKIWMNENPKKAFLLKWALPTTLGTGLVSKVLGNVSGGGDSMSSMYNLE